MTPKGKQLVCPNKYGTAGAASQTIAGYMPDVSIVAFE